MVYKRRREEVDNSDEDSDLDSDEREALEAFKNEGFNKDLEEQEAKRLKEVEDELDAKEAAAKEAHERDEAARKQKQAEELKAKELAAVQQESLPTEVAAAPAEAPREDWSSHPNYKTKLCVRFQAGGCNFGDRCGFAHGIEDLRSKPPSAPVPPIAMNYPVGIPPVPTNPGMMQYYVQPFPQAMPPAGMSGMPVPARAPPPPPPPQHPNQQPLMQQPLMQQPLMQQPLMQQPLMQQPLDQSSVRLQSPSNVQLNRQVCSNAKPPIISPPTVSTSYNVAMPPLVSTQPPPPPPPPPPSTS